MGQSNSDFVSGEDCTDDMEELDLEEESEFCGTMTVA